MMDRNDSDMPDIDAGVRHGDQEVDHISDARKIDHEQLLEFIGLIDAVPYWWQVERRELLFVGVQAVTLFGFPLEAWRDSDFWENRIHPEDLASTMADYDAALRRRQDAVLEYRFRAAQGHWLWIRDSVRFVVTSNGLCAIGTLVDVTSHKHIEEALRSSEDLLRSLVDAIPASINVTDLDGRYRLVNQAYAQRHGRTAAEFLGYTTDELFDADYAARVASLSNSVLRSGRATNFQERVQRRADGANETWLTSKVPLHGADGRIQYIAGIALDITERKNAERALLVSEERHRRLVESANAIPYTFDINSKKFMYVGPQFTRLLGHPVESLESHESWTALIHPVDRVAAVSASVLANPDLTEYTTEYRMIAADGRIVWIRDYCVNESSDDGARVEYGLAFDISREKMAEQALKESEAKYRAIVEDQTEFVVRYLPGGIMTFVNPAYCRRFSVTEEQLIGRSWYNSLAEGDRARIEARLASISPDSPVAAIEHQRVLPGGEVRWESWINRGIFDRNGRVEAYQAVGRDVTDMKLAEEMVRESERRFRHLVESTDAVPYSMDIESGRFTYVGPQAVRLLGYPVEDWSDEQFWESTIHPEERDRLVAQWKKIKTTTGDESQEYRMIRKDGSTVWIRDILRLEIQDSGRTVAYGLMLDITNHKEREEQLRQAQKMDIVGQMTGGVAHDFNNLLTVIIGNLHLLERTVSDNPTAVRRLNLIKGAAERGAELTKGLLAFARRQTLQGKRTDVNVLVSGMAELLRRTLGEGIQIDLELCEEPWSTVVDPAQLESVLVNLAVNARDAMGQSGSLHVETANMLVDVGEGDLRPFIMIAVRDTGCGMSPEVLGKVYEPFFTTKPVGQGTGLGLSMVYGTVKQSGGRIEISSAVGEGTTVRIYLPRADVVSDPVQAAAAQAPVPARTPTVLLVEPEVDARKLAAAVLTDSNHRVIEAEGGPQALSVMETHAGAIDLMITNLAMPGNMSGVVLAHEATRRLPQLKVLLCSNALPGTGDQQWILKPYVAADLIAKVKAALSEGERT